MSSPACEPAREPAYEYIECVDATDIVEGESRGSRGVIGGVGHWRGVAFGHERGVSSPACEPAREAVSEGVGDERRELERRLEVLFICARQNSLKSTPPSAFKSAATKIERSLAGGKGFAPWRTAASSASSANSPYETTPSWSRSCCSKRASRR